MLFSVPRGRSRRFAAPPSGLARAIEELAHVEVDKLQLDLGAVWLRPRQLHTLRSSCTRLARVLRNMSHGHTGA